MIGCVDPWMIGPLSGKPLVRVTYLILLYKNENSWSSKNGTEYGHMDTQKALQRNQDLGYLLYHKYLIKN